MSSISRAKEILFRNCHNRSADLISFPQMKSHHSSKFTANLSSELEKSVEIESFHVSYDSSFRFPIFQTS